MGFSYCLVFTIKDLTFVSRMKKRISIFSLFLLVMLPAIVDAQPGRGGRFNKKYHGSAKFMYYGVGVKSGFDFLNLDMKYSGDGDKYDFSGQNNYHVGISGEYFIKPNINLRVDVLHNHRELKLDYIYGEDLDPSENDNIPDHVLWKLNYLSIPLRANYNFIYRQHVKCYVSGGFAPVFKTNTKEEVTYLSGREEKNYNLLYNNRFNAVNMNMNISLGVRYNFTAHIGIEIEAGLVQYAIRLNRDYSAGAPGGSFLDFGFFYDFEKF